MTAGAPALTALLDELDRLRAAATQGEWKHEHDDYGDEWWFGGTQDGGQEVINGAIVTGADGAADAALIVAAVNAVPRLTAAVRAALALADEWGRWQSEETPLTTNAYRHAAADLRSTIAAALEAS